MNKSSPASAPLFRGNQADPDMARHARREKDKKEEEKEIKEKGDAGETMRT